MKTCIIVINYNGKDLLKKYLPSVVNTEGDNYEIWVVDNASTDGSAEFVNKIFPHIKIIRNLKNEGWAEGNNIAIRQALGSSFDLIVLLNNDIILPSFWLAETIKLLRADNKYGVLGYSIVGEHQRKSIQAYESKVALWESIEINETHHISGCAMVVQSNVFEKIGEFDSIYFCYGEEVDFQMRARKYGYRIGKTNIPIWHAVQGTSSKTPLKTAYLCLRNDLRLSIKQIGIWCFITRLLKLLYNITWFFRDPGDDIFIARIRPSNFFVNNGILFLAILWNIIYLPQTIIISIRESRRMKARG